MTDTKFDRGKLMGCTRMDKYKDLPLQTEGNMCTLSRLISDHPRTTLSPTLCLGHVSRRPGEEALGVFTAQYNAALAIETLPPG